MILLDCPNLCYRAFYGLPSLSINRIPTNVIFGFFRDILKFQKLFNTDDIVFCFDEGESKRVELLPSYKYLRSGKLDAPITPGKEVKHLHRQMLELRDNYLPRIGFRNIFHQKGYEADDIIGSLVETNKDKAIIVVSEDKDLYQLLSKVVRIYRPVKGSLYTEDDLWKEYKLTPQQWIDLKAMSGCTSDCIPGIAGIGETNAAKFLRGELKSGYVAHGKVVRGRSIWQSNLKLVKLPFEGTPVFEIRENKIDKDTWRQILSDLNMTRIKV